MRLLTRGTSMIVLLCKEKSLLPSEKAEICSKVVFPLWLAAILYKHRDLCAKLEWRTSTVVRKA
jgi:hypothetical protein